MAFVSFPLMTKIWKQVASAAPGQVLPMHKRHLKDQKTLSKFVSTHLLELREDAAGVGLYTFHVVVEAFSSLTPKPQNVRRPAIDRAWALPPAELSQIAYAAEPHVAQYLEDALTEDDDEVVLTDEEYALCSRVVQTAILCLHTACKDGSVADL